MAQHRGLVPLTVYLPAQKKTAAEARAAEKSIAVATLLRMIILGAEPPLNAP